MAVLAQWTTAGPEATRKLGTNLGRILTAGALLALEGNLGSGKTVFVQGLARGLGIKKPGEIRSPTFAIIQENKAGKIPLCHVDLYRIKNESEWRERGIEELLALETALSFIEWSSLWPNLEKQISQLCSGNVYKLTFEFGDDPESRTLEVNGI